jgi:hypothetical protein
VPVEVFLGFARVGLGRDRFVHECTRGIGRTVFPVRPRGQDGKVVKVLGSKVDQRGEHDFLIAPAFSVFSWQRHGGFATGEQGDRGEARFVA